MKTPTGAPAGFPLTRGEVQDRMPQWLRGRGLDPTAVRWIVQEVGSNWHIDVFIDGVNGAAVTWSVPRRLTE